MAHIRQGRHTADLQAAGGEVIVFLIGMRINKPWKLRQWFPVFVAMPKMLNYLQRNWSGVAREPGVSAGQLGEGGECLDAVFGGGL